MKDRHYVTFPPARDGWFFMGSMPIAQWHGYGGFAPNGAYLRLPGTWKTEKDRPAMSGGRAYIRRVRSFAWNLT
jgi:hypothetical protein